MTLIDWMLLAAIFAAIIFAIRSVKSSRKKGGCCGCCSSCGGCKDAPHSSRAEAKHTEKPDL